MLKSKAGISLNGGPISNYNDMSVSGVKFQDGEVPFADILTQYENYGNTLTLTHDQSTHNYDGILEQTDGCLDGGDYTGCDDCGERTHEEDVTCVGDSYVCGNCYAENYSCCEHCQTVHHNDDGTYVECDGTSVCNTCLLKHYVKCFECDDIVALDDSHCIDNGLLCYNCYNTDYFTCADCETVAHNDAANTGGDDELYCGDCIAEHVKDDDEQAVDVDGQIMLNLRMGV